MSTASGAGSALELTGPDAAAPPPAVAPRAVEGELCAVLREVLGIAAAPAEANFFADLGADSMLMAQFCARVRKHGNLPKISMKDVYANPNIRLLAAALAPSLPAEPTTDAAPSNGAAAAPTAGAATTSVPTPAVGTPPTRGTSPTELSPDDGPGRPARASRLQFGFCAGVQLLFLLAPIYAGGLLGAFGYHLIRAGHGILGTYLHAVACAAILVVGMLALPIVAKWTLIGRFRVEEIPAWTPRYLRFWIVKTLIIRNPLTGVLVGSPLYPLYLRALGARVGRGTLILTRNFPVCTDLISIGSRTVIRKEVMLKGYQAHDGAIRTGRVTLGDDVVVGARSVLDIDTSIGADGQLGHASALHPGQTVPPGERWEGSPARPGTTDFAGLPATGCNTLRGARFATWQLLGLVLVATPLAMFLGGLLSLAAAHLAGLGTDWGHASLTGPRFYGRAMFAAAVVVLGGVVLVLALVVGLARGASALVRPGRVYRLYGTRHAALRTIERVSNIKFYPGLSGDSWLIVHYLRLLGYRLKPYRQTGTNFGLGVMHESPTAVSVGTGTVIADGLCAINVDYSAAAFRVREARIGAESFLGNFVVYPASSRVGDNCLLATKVMVPTDGEIREGVGLLGSPAFQIPRTVSRDQGLAVEDAAELRRGLRAKSRHNAVSVALALALLWVDVVLILIYAEGAGELYLGGGTWTLGLANLALTLAGLAWFLLIGRSVNRLCALRPTGVSIYEVAFWRHERFWKLPSQLYLQLFNGTPFKIGLWRALGVHVGRGVLDDGLSLSEKIFVTIGDNATFNTGSVVQCHSQEDGAFKSDRVTIASGVTLGVGSFVHYGVTMGQNSELAADSFLMKGEEVPAHALWGGNPAREMAASSGDATTPVGGIS